jgi:hypothetical protein
LLATLRRQVSNSSRRCAAVRPALQHLEVRDLIGADDPNASAGQSLGLAVAPEHLFGALLEALVQPRRAPVARAVRLQVHLLQEAADQGGADRLNDPVG